ncbi:ATP-grasp domain-containing protein, partial [Gemmata sp. JC673]
SVIRSSRDCVPTNVPEPVVYVTTKLAVLAARTLDIALLEPPFDLLTRVPGRFLRRAVEFATFADLTRLQKRTFVKPADPLDKWFDAGLYGNARDIRTCGRSCPDAPVLLSEPVEWSVELRYFVLEGRVVAGSPYLSYGRPAWRRTDASGPLPTAGRPLVEQLCADMKDRLPPVFVVDVGLIEDRGWAVVEFNPVWSAGLLNADPRAVFPALQRASQRRTELTDVDRRWDLRK